jgi:hypothetical protein
MLVTTILPHRTILPQPLAVTIVALEAGVFVGVLLAGSRRRRARCWRRRRCARGGSHSVRGWRSGEEAAREGAQERVKGVVARS